ncbi:hypothetical protein EPICR_10159 [Candidatus Desulfarcum epimagneticum]|uniref:Uncharacterized protein n=1 Tax=uncultured Desulfobacteraceae bacterium TaxID=218296 RepID=A0A484HE08_9BACT|nr:hypothetical protein EPICR_10159 [uncultured Desulfobacteraceae bacterium]
MIAINLMGRRRKMKIRKVRNQAFVFALLTAVLCMALALHNASLEARVEEIKGLSARHGKKAQRLFAIKAEMDAFKKKERALSEIAGDRSWPVRLLGDLAGAVPQGRVWLTDLESDGKTAVIRGKSMDGADAALFIQRLKKTDFFKDVRLKILKKQKGPDGKDQTLFELACPALGTERK